jgi:molecular chaperone Hsp33
MDSPAGDQVAAFQIENQPVRGRITALGQASLDPILKRHDYPVELARILGEALMLAVLAGSSIKFEGRLLVQAEGDGVVSMLVGEYRTDGGLRAYARFDRERWDNLQRINKGQRPHMPQLFGKGGRLALIIVHDDPSMSPYQGIVPLVKATLAECAEDYFNQSEQVPTRVRLAVGQLVRSGEADAWCGGGALIQQVAGDDARGETLDAWETAQALFATLSEDELIDPLVGSQALLWRVFHETGVRLEPAQGLSDACTCSEARLRATLQAMPDDSLRELAEPDGTLAADCQFCGRTYRIPVGDVTTAVN